MKRSHGLPFPGHDWLTAGEDIALNDVVRLSAADTCLKAGNGEPFYGVALMAVLAGARLLVRTGGRATVVANATVAVGDRVVPAGVVGPPDTRGRVIPLNTEPAHSHALTIVGGQAAGVAIQFTPDTDAGVVGKTTATTRTLPGPANSGIQDATGPTTGRVLGKALTAAGGAGVSLTVMLEG